MPQPHNLNLLTFEEAAPVGLPIPNVQGAAFCPCVKKPRGTDRNSVYCDCIRPENIPVPLVKKAGKPMDKWGFISLFSLRSDGAATVVTRHAKQLQGKGHRRTLKVGAGQH